jgi:hypothetical protein
LLILAYFEIKETDIISYAIKKNLIPAALVPCPPAFHALNKMFDIFPALLFDLHESDTGTITGIA